MTCAICQFYDVCYIHDTIEACTHEDPHEFGKLMFSAEL